MKLKLIGLIIMIMSISLFGQELIYPESLENIASKMIKTDRLNIHVLTSGPEDGIPVIFIHGNFSAAAYWEEIMLALPSEYRAIAPDLRGYGITEDKKIDATRGMLDWCEDLDVLLDKLEIEKAHIVGWSLGGGVVFQFIADHPEKVLSATLISPVSPYGFGGTKDLDGTPCYADFAGSGGGTVNPEFIRRIQIADRTIEDANSPQSVINAYYYKPPFHADREDAFLSASLFEKTGEDKYPGDFIASENWPNVAPGIWGPINAGSPKYVSDIVPRLLAANPKPSILWIRGSDDMIVSDNSLFDLGALGKLGYVPGWPGDDIYPPQPMVSQTRTVLEIYSAENGSFKEVVINETAHSPHIEKPDEFNNYFHKFLKKNKQTNKHK